MNSIKENNSSSNGCLNPSHQPVILQAPLHASAFHPTRRHHSLFPAHSPCTPRLGDDVLSVWSAQPPPPLHAQTWPACPRPAQEVDSRCCPRFLQSAVSHLAAEIPWRLLFIYMTFNLSYGIKHCSPSTVIICTCYTRLHYLREEMMLGFFSTTEPITIFGIQLAFDAPLLN